MVRIDSLVQSANSKEKKLVGNRVIEIHIDSITENQKEVINLMDMEVLRIFRSQIGISKSIYTIYACINMYIYVRIIGNV